MVQQRYSYSVRIHREDGSCLCQASLPVDWQPALESAWFQGLRRREIDLADGTRSSAIRPVWHPDIGEPYVSGFRATILSENLAGASEDFTTAYFHREAKRIVLDLVRQGRVRENETVRCLFTASFDETHAEAGPASPFTVRERPPEVSLTDARLSDIVGRDAVASASAGKSQEAGATDASANAGNAANASPERSLNDRGYPVDYPIVIPRGILDETRALVSAARPDESGGILAGRLHRDSDSGDLFAVVTAHIPAEHTTSTPERLTFTVETWTAARAALDRRGRGEIFLGWTHYHPAPDGCASCPPEKKALCAITEGFFSPDDYELHRVVFPRAYSFALVFSPGAGDDVQHALFGWRRGALERRDFHVAGSADDRKVRGGAIVRERTGTGGRKNVTDRSPETRRRQSDSCDPSR